MTVACQLRMPDQSHFFRHIESNAARVGRVVTADSHLGQSVVICGAGPSLATECERLPLANEVWACNSALPYLVSRHVRVTHGVCIDQGTAMLGPDEWERAFDVRYLIASSVHPRLVQHLVSEDRRVTFFHNYLGIPDPDGWERPQPHVSYEGWLYTDAHLYPTSVQVGHGLNAVPRAICLALAMGFSHITVVGADCGVPDQPPMPEPFTADYHAWMRALPMYADGRTASAFGDDSAMTEAPDLDGRRWHTRPDMLISAVHLLEIADAFPGRVTLVGDTLPNALHGKDAEFMARLPRLTATGEVVGFGNASLPRPEVSQPLEPLEAIA